MTFIYVILFYFRLIIPNAIITFMGTWERNISMAFMCLAVLISLPDSFHLSLESLLPVKIYNLSSPCKVWLTVMGRSSAYSFLPLD